MLSNKSNPDPPKAENQKGLITKTRKLESTKFFFSFVFSSFRAFVIIKFFQKMHNPAFSGTKRLKSGGPFEMGPPSNLN
jgi:hypothetical protein